MENTGVSSEIESSVSESNQIRKNKFEIFKKNKKLLPIFIVFVSIIIFVTVLFSLFFRPSPELSTYKNLDIAIPTIPLASDDKKLHTYLFEIIENEKSTRTKEISYMQTYTNFAVLPFSENGKIYYLDGDMIKSYDFSTDVTADVYILHKDEIPRIDSLEVIGKYLYITIGETDASQGDIQTTMKEINLITKDIREMKNLEKGRSTLSHYLFSTNDGKDITHSKGGDGCGGWGSVIKYDYKTSSSTLISEYGDGCSTQPRYIGYFKLAEQVIFANGKQVNIPDSKSLLPFTFEFDSLYGIDVNTLTKVPLYDLKKLPNLNQVIMNEERTQIAFIADKEIQVFDLLQNQLVQKTSLREDVESVEIFENGILYSVDGIKLSLTSINLNTGVADTIPLNGKMRVALLGAANGNVYLLRVK